MQPGYRIEHYVLIEQIGQGGQAAVWSAEDEQLKRTVAIKTINLSSPLQPGVQQSSLPSTIPPIEEQSRRFLMEAQIIATLEHPFILPIYSYGQKDEWLYIVMRYMAGGTLRKLVQHHLQTLEEVIKLAEPLADALDLAHKKSIVHRDIKSVNILLDAQHRPYLADFGLSVTVGDSSASSGSGTLAYMSPEQIKGGAFDHRADIYAFGILLFEMFTGSAPIYDRHHWNLAQVTEGVPLPVPDDMPYEVAEVLRRATALDPQHRYASATELVRELRQANQKDRKTETTEVDVLLPITDPALLASIEAHNLFDSAVQKWADGAGRFRLYEEDFQYIDSYFRSGENWNIVVDEAAKRMLLRAALEYGTNLDHWWAQVEDQAERRAVMLQTLTSELPTARLRAIQYLTILEDANPPAIPIRVANIISAEPDTAVRLAGVKLLEQRATASLNWRETAYSSTIDTILVEIVTKDNDPQIAETAARVSGRLHSTLAVTQVADAAAKGNAQALRALISIRDEVNAFPAGVPGDLKRRVFTSLTIRQLFQPGLIARFGAAALGFALTWAVFAYNDYIKTSGAGNLLIAQAVGNAVASGVFYGLIVALGVVAASEPAQRLRPWSRPGRIILSLILGTILCMSAFAFLRTYYYFITDPVDPVWLLVTSVTFISGFAIASGLTRRTWLRALVGGIGVFVAGFGGFLLYPQTSEQLPLLITDPKNISLALTLNVLMAISLGCLTYLPEWIAKLRKLGRTIG